VEIRLMRRLLAWTLVFVIGSVPARPGRTAPTPGGNDEAVPTLAGQLLVAEPELGDPNFAQTVVLVLHHGRDGALGLVVNRPYGTAPLAALVERLGLGAVASDRQVAVGYGGPVDPDTGFLVHDAGYAVEGTIRVTDRIAVTPDPKALTGLAGPDAPAHALVTLGYAGWGPGQLDGELARGDWDHVAAEPDLVFAADPAATWDRARSLVGTDL
jgi:putative transcriptional regulator